MDLTSNLFFTTKFELDAKVDGDDTLWLLVLNLRRWVTEKCNRPVKTMDTALPVWSRFKLGGKLFSSDAGKSTFLESVFFHPQDADGEQYWACRMVERRPAEAGFAPPGVGDGNRL